MDRRVTQEELTASLKSAITTGRSEVMQRNLSAILENCFAFQPKQPSVPDMVRLVYLARAAKEVADLNVSGRANEIGLSLMQKTLGTLIDEQFWQIDPMYVGSDELKFSKNNKMKKYLYQGLQSLFKDAGLSLSKQKLTGGVEQTPLVDLWDKIDGKPGGMAIARNQLKSSKLIFTP